MCARRAAREADDVPRSELVASILVAKRRRTGQDEKPFLLGVLVVIGADRLARRKLVDARAELLGVDQGPEAERSDTETFRIFGVIRERRVGDVDALHSPNLPAQLRAPARRETGRRRSGACAAC